MEAVVLVLKVGDCCFFLLGGGAETCLEIVRFETVPRRLYGFY